MKYRVLWSPYAEQRLEQILQSAVDPLAITAAARQIDRIPLVSPAAFGESRYEAICLAAWLVTGDNSCWRMAL